MSLPPQYSPAAPAQIDLLVHVADGLIVSASRAFPSPPLNADGTVNTVDYAIVTIAGDRLPDPRTERWDHTAAALRAATADETAAYDVAQPRYVDSMTVIARMTDDENFAIMALARTDKGVARFMNMFLCRSQNINVNDALSQQGWAYLKSVGVPSVWPDAATATSRVAALTA